MASLDDRLRGRKLPTQVVQIAADADEHARLSRELAAALWTLEEARSRGAVSTADDQARVERLQALLDAAETLDVALTALPPDVWENLVAQCPPGPEDLARGHQWDVRTFRPALLALSVVGEDVPPNWELLAKEGRITAGELQALFDAAVMLNLRGLSAAVGKGR